MHINPGLHNGWKTTHFKIRQKKIFGGLQDNTHAGAHTRQDNATLSSLATSLSPRGGEIRDPGNEVATFVVPTMCTADHEFSSRIQYGHRLMDSSDTVTMSVIPRAKALALQGYRQCCHVMLHSPVEEKLFGFYPVKHTVLVSNPYVIYCVWRQQVLWGDLPAVEDMISKPVRYTCLSSNIVEPSSCIPIF